MITLGIETSCDETGIAIYDDQRGLLGHKLYSQVALHAEYGGVVPELASRDHIRKVIPLIEQLMQETGLLRNQIDGVAYTQGPGLVGALMVGSAIGRSIAFAWGVHAIGVHHMEGHLLAPMLEENPPEFPFTALLVSGGHTLIVDVEGIGKYKILGESIDDAAGEAFDKTAKMLELGYPGGPILAKLAQQGHSGIYKFPRPMTDRPGLDFSFSGLKTFTLNTWLSSEQTAQNKADIARAFQDAVVDTIAIKCRRAMELTRHKRLIIAGGVGANIALREKLEQLGTKMGFNVYYPRIEFCTDNGAMIAFAGAQRLKAGETANMGFTTTPRWPIESLIPPC